MTRCDQVRPLVHCVVEGETTPEEAMLVARHLPACTACKILLAKERRLARMLEQEMEDFPVSEDFVQSVMDSLAEVPEPKTATTKRRRGLKLAALAGLVGTWTALSAHEIPVPGRLPSFGSSPDLHVSDVAPAGVRGLLETVASTASISLPELPQGLALPLLVGGAATALLGAAAVMLLLVAGCVRRPRSCR
ncbi:MAG: hypothetical protein GY716_06405 [bacterium]|nr:hypothetical protein [bacterium]